MIEKGGQGKEHKGRHEDSLIRSKTPGESMSHTGGIFERPSQGDFGVGSPKKETSPTEPPTKSPEKGEIVFQAEAKEGRGELTLSEIGEGLAATGNNEAKAILLSAMERGKEYTPWNLLEVKEKIEGGYPGWEFMKSGQLEQYCLHSFLSAGLVEKTERGFRKTEKGFEFDALNGQLSHFSERHTEYSLQDFFPTPGAPAAKARIKEGSKEEETAKKAKNPVLLRFRILQQLGGKNPPTRLTELATELEEDKTVIGRHLRNLSDKNVITYRSSAIRDNSKNEYTAIRPESEYLPAPFQRKVKLTHDIYAIVKEADSISTEAVYRKLVESDNRRVGQGAEKRYKALTMNRVSLVLHYLEREGYAEGNYPGQSDISFTPYQRGVIGELVKIIENFQKGDPAFLDEGKRKAKAIVDKPTRAAPLLHKAEKKSSLTNQVSPKGTMNQIKEIVASAPKEGFSNTQIREALKEKGNDLSDGSIKRCTLQMRETGELTGHQKGRTFFYRLGEKKSPSESDKED